MDQCLEECVGTQDRHQSTNTVTLLLILKWSVLPYNFFCFCYKKKKTEQGAMKFGKSSNKCQCHVSFECIGISNYNDHIIDNYLRAQSDLVKSCNYFLVQPRKQAGLPAWRPSARFRDPWAAEEACVFSETPSSGGPETSVVPCHPLLDNYWLLESIRGGRITLHVKYRIHVESGFIVGWNSRQGIFRLINYIL